MYRQQLGDATDKILPTLVGTVSGLLEADEQLLDLLMIGGEQGPSRNPIAHGR